jgi:ring-1,2-phenylacetyl-CoA epoxidase subunit PaaD
MSITLIETVTAAVTAVSDPELAGISIGDLGLVRSVAATSEGSVQIILVPTFLGCPALNVIKRDAEAAARVAGALTVDVQFDYSSPWTTKDVSDTGRRALADYGIAVSDANGCACPYCNSRSLRQLSPVGPAACRSAYWCDACRNVVEVFRDSQPLSTVLSLPTRRPSVLAAESQEESVRYVHV